MRKFLFVGMLALLFSCANQEPEFLPDSAVAEADTYSDRKIGLSEAENYAHLFFSKLKATKGSDDARFSVDYYIEDGIKTKSTSLPSDTLAYIMNDVDGDGFVLISTTKTVFPILAFSDKGQFNLKEKEGSPVYDEFLSLLDEYYEVHAGEAATTHDVDSFLSTCVVGELAVSSCWHQGDPFNKYVTPEHPGCPAGCVAVATGLAMTYCKPVITYHDEYFDNAEITKAMKNESSIMTKEQAIDRIAKLLYFIGKDLNMNYAVGGSEAYSDDALDLVKKLGYTASSFKSYNIIDIIKEMRDRNSIIYMDGREVGKPGGHAWIVDGYHYCYKVNSGGDGWQTTPSIPDENSEIDENKAFLNCDWGWGGTSNGYYQGEVFDAKYHKFKNMIYFPVVMEY